MLAGCDYNAKPEMRLYQQHQQHHRRPRQLSVRPGTRCACFRHHNNADWIQVGLEVRRKSKRLRMPLFLLEGSQQNFSTTMLRLITHMDRLGPYRRVARMNGGRRSCGPRRSASSHDKISRRSRPSVMLFRRSLFGSATAHAQKYCSGASACQQRDIADATGKAVSMGRGATRATVWSVVPDR